MSKVVKGTGSFKENAIPFSKGKQNLFKGALGLKKPKVDTSAQDEAIEQQRLQQAELDEEENRRKKRLTSAAQGARAFAGSPLFRRAPGNRAGAAASSASSGTSARSGGGSYRSGRANTMIP